MLKIKKTFLLIALFFATALLLLSFWVIQQKSGGSSDSLTIGNVLISAALDDKPSLVESVLSFPYGVRQVYLRFDYAKATEDGEVKILWLMGEKLVQSDIYSLPGTKGTKVYSLVRENGQPLPKGAYAVEALNGSERLLESKFEIGGQTQTQTKPLDGFTGGRQ
ncbi:MAG: hypothetical protein LBD04_01175 [Synergistaceae bacterium]|jgi:hypothetical protein|nr:hypothetical protein [Synergistaceae bacterium]